MRDTGNKLTKVKVVEVSLKNGSADLHGEHAADATDGSGHVQPPHHDQPHQPLLYHASSHVHSSQANTLYLDMGENNSDYYVLM